MMHADATRTGASFVAKHAQDNPRELVISLVEESPGASKDELFARFRSRIEDEPAYQRAVDWYFFVNMYEYLVTSRNRKPTTKYSKAEIQRDVDVLKARVTQIVLLDLILPNGKALRDASFADCAKAGGFFAKIAKKGKPNQVVGKVLTEDQLRALR